MSDAPRLYDMTRIAEVLSERLGVAVRPHTVQMWRHRGQLPKAIEPELAVGPVWDAGTIEPWIEEKVRAIGEARRRVSR